MVEESSVEAQTHNWRRCCQGATPGAGCAVNHAWGVEAVLAGGHANWRRGGRAAATAAVAIDRASPAATSGRGGSSFHCCAHPKNGVRRVGCLEQHGSRVSVAVRRPLTR